jgi:cytochrome P450
VRGEAGGGDKGVGPGEAGGGDKGVGPGEAGGGDKGVGPGESGGGDKGVGPGEAMQREGGVRDDVVALRFDEMAPEMQALIAYAPNHAYDVLDSQRLLQRVLRESPVVRWDMGIGFFRMDDIVAAARNPAIVSTNPATGVPQGMGSREPLIPLHIDGERHREARRLLDPLLAPKMVAPVAVEVKKLANDLIDGFVDDGHAELHDAFCVPLPSTIFLRLFGLPPEDADFLIWAKDRVLNNEGATLEEKERLGIEAGDQLRARLRAHIEERHREPVAREDWIGRFMTFEVDGDRLSDDDLINIMHLFTIAGLDTVTSSLSCIIGRFAAHPDERARVVADTNLLAAAIEELMRFESPVPGGGARWATEDTEVNGVPVRAGDMVYLCWATANLDPRAFERPLTVELERSPNRHVAFAAGTHRCLGSHLARVELRAAIEQLHERIPDYWVTPGETIVYESHGVRQACRLPLTFRAAG